MTLDEHKTALVKQMKSIGVYHKEFAKTVDVLAQMLADYDCARAAFEESGEFVVEYTNKAGATNLVKNPHYSVIETLRESILKYTRELGLTPTGLKKVNEQAMKSKKKSALAEALNSIG